MDEILTMRPPPHPHLGNDLHGQFKRRPKMHSHRPLEILSRHVLERADFDDASVVDQDIDLPETVDRLADGQLNLLGIEEVTLNGKHSAATSCQISLCPDQFIIIPRQQRHLAACGTNLSCQHQTQSTRSAGDKRDFVA